MVIFFYFLKIYSNNSRETDGMYFQRKSSSSIFATFLIDFAKRKILRDSARKRKKEGLKMENKEVEK